jgi:predicted dienelactone hydrolase
MYRFPNPGGPYDIGTLTYHWVDADRREVLAADPDARRELMVQIWYPAKAVASSPHAAYSPDAEILSSALAGVHHKPKFLFRNLKHLTTNAIASAPLADGELAYPVLIFLEGLTGFRQMNTFQVEELVSHGYVVAAIDQPYTAAAVVFPDGRQVAVLPLEQIQALVHQSYSPAERAPILNGRVFEGGIAPYLAQDVVFALQQLAALNEGGPHGLLTGRLDLQHPGVFGVSLGGIVAGQACQLEPRFRACLVMDAAMPTAVVENGLQQPTMWITRDAETMRLERRRAGGWSEAEIYAHHTSMRAVFESLPGDGYFVQVSGMFHVDMTDGPLLWPLLASRLGLSGPIGVQRAHHIVNAYSLAFFDRYLKGRRPAMLNGPAAPFPEVSLQTRRP